MSANDNVQYTVYDPKTTLPIAFGRVDEVIEALGMNRSTFCSAASRYRKGSYKKYIIIREENMDADAEE